MKRAGDRVLKLLEQLKKIEWKYPEFDARKAQFIWRTWLWKIRKGIW